MAEPTPTVTSDMTESLAPSRDGVASYRNFSGRGGRGHRGRGGRGGRGRVYQSPGNNFKGNTEGMNNNVFQCFNESADKKQFAKTVEALGEYAAKHMDYAGDMASLFRDLTKPTITKPQELPATETSKLEITIWEKTVATYCKRLDILESNLSALYAIIWGQCSEAMKAKLISLTDYKTHSDANDCVWILKEIKGITYSFEGQRYIFLSLALAHSTYDSYRQGPDVSLADYLHQYRTNVEVYEHYGGGIGYDPGLLEYVKNKTSCTDKEAKAGARDRLLALNFLRFSDQRRFGTLWTDLENQFTRGNDQYPTDLTAAYSMLVNFRLPRTLPTRSPSTPSPTPTTGVAFAQTATPISPPIAGSDGVLHTHITCYQCNRKGHYASTCLTPTAGIQMVQTSDFSFTQHGAAPVLISPLWVLLDSQSTISIFNNANLLRNIRPGPTTLKVHSTGGVQFSHLIGDIPNFGWVWYHPRSIAHILSLAQVRRQCRVTMDTSSAPALCVHRTNGSVMTFVEHANGLYFHDTSTTSSPNPPTHAASPHFSFLTTVASSSALFPRREVEGAALARGLYRKLGRPSQRQFERILEKNLIHNCPVTTADAKRALMIYGPDVATLKGKTTKGQSEHVPSTTPITLPTFVQEHHRDVTLAMDVFYVQDIPFFHTISRKIHFRTVAPIESRRKGVLLLEAQTVIKLYQARGFRVTSIHADMEFECLRHDLLPIELNVTAADDHVGDIERSVRTMKERTRATVQGLPYRRLPILMVKEVVKHTTKTLNMFAMENDLSDTLSPRTIVTGSANPDYNKLRLEFGAYAQVFENNDPTNTMATRTTGAIALNATDNLQGDYYFMSLTTGAKLSRHQWTELPISEAVIAAVEAMAERQGQRMIRGGPIFEWRPQVPIEDNFDADIGQEEEIEQPPVVFVENESIDGLDPPVDENEALEDDVIDEAENGLPEENNDGESEPAEVTGDSDQSQLEEEEESDESDEDITQEENQGGLSAHNLRPRRGRNYDHMYGTDYEYEQGASLTQLAELLERENIQGVFHDIVGFMMTQMTATAGIKKHGDAAINALFKELAQLDEKNVFIPLNASTLTGQQKRAALRAINLIKEKRNGLLKARTCADGSAQRSLYSREETMSPTLANDALMLSLMIDAYERRDVAVADVVGAYLNAEMRDFVVMRLTGDAVDIMCKVNPRYTTFVTMEHGKAVLYVQLARALYGCVTSALLWYDLFATTLQERGFTLNPYNPCVANCEIEGSQCTVVWYVDDNKISHKSSAVVTSIIEAIEEKFGKMTVTRGSEHTFLGMDVSFPGDGTVTIHMSAYLEQSLELFGENLEPVGTPATKGLFDINEDSPALDTNRKETFHTIVAKLLYVAHRGRPDLQPTIPFLCTRVTKSTEEDWGKLRRLLQYIKGSMELKLTLGAMNYVSLKHGLMRPMPCIPTCAVTQVEQCLWVEGHLGANRPSKS